MTNLRRLPVEQLIPAPYNPRVALRPGDAGYRRLERSLNEFGLVQPIVWNEQTGHVVGGHQRLEILKNQGAAAIDVVVVSLSPEREKALNVALNNPQVGGDWDPDRLLDLVGELAGLTDFDPTLTGFDEDDLRDLLLTPDRDLPDEPADEDDLVRVTLEVPADDWDAVRPDVDQLVAFHDLAVHVRLPTGL